MYLNKKPLKEVIRANRIISQTFPQDMNLILSQLEIDLRDLNRKYDAQKVKTNLDLCQMVEVRRRFATLAISARVLLKIVEEEFGHVVFLLGVHGDLVSVHPAEVVEGSEELRQQPQRHSH